MEVKISDMLAPIESDKPCGDFIDDNSQLFSMFSSLEIILEGKPETQVGDSVIPSIKPDWKRVATESLALMAKTKDVRVAVYWAHSQLSLRGFDGLDQGLVLVEGMCSSFWEDAYPKLVDEDGDFNPEYRLNALNHFSSDDFIDMLQSTKLTASKTLGAFSYRDYLIAKGELVPLNDADHVPLQHITSAFMDTDISILTPLHNNLSQISSTTQSILGLIEDKLGSNEYVDIESFLGIILAMQALLLEHLQLRNASTTIDNMNETESLNSSAGELDHAASVSASAGISVQHTNVRSRDDVTILLDRICQYYALNEPSSPVPLMLNRAKTLVSMDFLSLINDITPESLDQVKKIAGLKDSVS